MGESILLATCPRCGAENMTFDLRNDHAFNKTHGWKIWFETFCICRNCKRSTVFILSMKQPEDYIAKNGLTQLHATVNNYVEVEGFISLKDQAKKQPPEYLPDEILKVFVEGCTCLSVNCFNAAGTMFRLCLDFATSGLVPTEEVAGLTHKIRRDLGLRLPWLFDNGKLPEALRDLSLCVKDDGNDGAHRGNLGKEDAEDLLDFTYELLERIFTEPERIRIAQRRREERRQKSK